VAYDYDNDRYLAVWVTAVGGNWYVYGRIRTRTGQTIGEFPIEGGGNQERLWVSVAYGSFWYPGFIYPHRYLVVWQQKNGTDPGDIYCREINADTRQPMGSVTRLSPAPPDPYAQERPRLTFDSGLTDAGNGQGQYLVVWQAKHAAGTYYDVFGKLVRPTSGGAPWLIDVGRIGGDNDHDQQYPDVAANPNDNSKRFLVVYQWLSSGGATPTHIPGRFVSNDGPLTGNWFPIMYDASASYERPSVACNPTPLNPHFLVAALKSASTPYARSVSAQGSLGPIFQLNDETYAGHPSVDMMNDVFEVIWPSYNGATAGRRANASGTVGLPFVMWGIENGSGDRWKPMGIACETGGSSRCLTIHSTGVKAFAGFFFR
jgi:hypothetical protein